MKKSRAQRKAERARGRLQRERRETAAKVAARLNPQQPGISMKLIRELDFEAFSRVDTLYGFGRLHPAAAVKITGAS